MSRLKGLIDELCPDGVEYKTLGSMGQFFGGLSGKTKADFGEGYPFVTYMNVFGNAKVNPEMVDYVRVGTSERQNMLHMGDVLFTVSSETPDECGMSSVVTFEPDGPLYLNSFCTGWRPSDDRLIPDYMAYALRSRELRKQIGKTANGVIRFNVSKPLLAGVRVPVPPIEAQREIVRILDSFQELNDALAAEIEAREKQFEWMLQEELSVSHLTRVEGNAVKMRAVRDIREKVITPIRAKPTDFKGTIPWCKLEDVVGYEIGDSLSGRSVSEETVASMGLNVYPAGTVLCSCSATLGVYCVTQKPLVTNQRFMGFVCSDEVVNRYLMYAMDASTTKLLTQATTGTNAYISRKAFEDHLIPVPSIRVQKQVVEELDSAYHLLNSLRDARDARRKQFEHYRDRLLSFPEKVA